MAQAGRITRSASSLCSPRHPGARVDTPVFSEQLIGLLSVRIADNRQIDGAELEFAQSLAHQATLALEMARLAEQAKQTALAIESEESRPRARRRAGKSERSPSRMS